MAINTVDNMTFGNKSNIKSIICLFKRRTSALHAILKIKGG